MKRPAHWLAFALAAAALAMVWNLRTTLRSRADSLSRLAFQAPAPLPTEVYGRPTRLISGATTQRRVEAALARLRYERVARPAALEPGQMSEVSGTLLVYTRPFAYPDMREPPRLLRLEFENGILHDVADARTGGSVSGARLEPERLARWGVREATREQVRLADLPAFLPAAVLASEDRRFYEHGAVDWRGVGRALWQNLRRRSISQGGSTLTQQLSRSVFLSSERTWSRKINETLLAFYLERRFRKDQILEMYLNQVYWGQAGSQSLLGIEEAARYYFGKPSAQLTLSEAALLVGILPSPNRYSPHRSADLARERRDRVLDALAQQRRAPAAALRAARQEPVRPARPPEGGTASYFLSSLQDVLSERYSPQQLFQGGLRIFTTLDGELQRAAEAAIKNAPAEGALVVIDQEGGVAVWVGGRSYADSPFDRAVRAHRQPGSAFKPFVALAAIESSTVTVATPLRDEPLVLRSSTGTWRPQNADRKFLGRVSLWDALVQSRNVPFVRLAQQTGLDRVAALARRCGIESPLRAVPSLALGTSEVTVLELTDAYATLARGGRRVPPFFLQSVLAADGTVLEQAVPAETEQAASPAGVYLVTQMLQAVLEEGTGKAARAWGLSGSAAGKTGTTENYQDAWFIGYTPRLTCGVWVGHDLPRSLGRAAAGVALPVWTAFMKDAIALDGDSVFVRPPGLIEETMDPESGGRARAGCPARVTRLCLESKRPDDCPLHAGGLRGLFQRWRRR